MKKVFGLFSIVFALIACKPESPKQWGHFGVKYEGILINNDAANKRFSVSLDYQEYFDFGHIKVGGKLVKHSLGQYSFSDSAGENIIFNGNTIYTFVNKLDNRIIYIDYNEELDNQINSLGKTVTLNIYGMDFYSDYSLL